MASVSIFRGLNNVTDALRTGLEWLTRADNINVTSTGAVESRSGYSVALAGITQSAYNTADFGRLYLQSGDTIKAVDDSMGVTILVSGLASVKPMQWAELNNEVYFTNGVDSGIIGPDNQVRAWRLPVPGQPAAVVLAGNLPPGQYQACATFLMPDGRESPASTAVQVQIEPGQSFRLDALDQLPGVATRVYIAPAGSTVYQHAGTPAGASFGWNQSPDSLGRELQTQFKDPLPLAIGQIAHWQGRFYAAMHLPELDKSAVWSSDPLAPHLWRLDEGYFMVPGRVDVLAPSPRGLIVGTNLRIHLYTPEGLTELAGYGAVPGYSWAADKDRTYFWTQRGLCAYPEFTNLTESRVSVAPGVQAGIALVMQDGQKRLIAALHKGGKAFNPKTL